MSWRALDVRAQLDTDGVLHVRERHVIVFDGPWNGGERVFDVRHGQRLRFERLLREMPGGRLAPLARGALDQVDHYDFADARTVRWRSRAPEAPPFAGTELTYVLEYSLSGVLVQTADDWYQLRHDFAFPDGTWPIRSARVQLELDPAWKLEGAKSLEPDPMRPAEGRAPLVFDRGELRPGASFVVAVDLRRGSGHPGAIWPAVPSSWRRSSVEQARPWSATVAPAVSLRRSPGRRSWTRRSSASTCSPARPR